MYCLKLISFTNYLASIFLDNNFYLQIFTFLNLLIQVFDIFSNPKARNNNGTIKPIYFYTINYLLFTIFVFNINSTFLQFSSIFFGKLYLDFYWSEQKNIISYDWFI